MQACLFPASSSASPLSPAPRKAAGEGPLLKQAAKAAQLILPLLGSFQRGEPFGSNPAAVRKRPGDR